MRQKSETPGGRTRGNQNSTQATAAEAIVLTPTDADAYANHIDGCFAVVVESPGDRYRRRLYLSLAAAEKAAQRARKRGQRVKVVLAVLTPLYVLTGTAQPELCHDGEQNEAGRTGVGSTDPALTPSTLGIAEEALP